MEPTNQTSAQASAERAMFILSTMPATRRRRWFAILDKLAAMSQAERDRFCDTFLDVVNPLPESRPHADLVMVAEGRAMLAGLPA